MIQIDVVIKMGEDCEKRMTLDEARNLYAELNRMFNSGQKQEIPVLPNPGNLYNPPIVSGNDRIATAKAEAEKRKEGGCGCGKRKEQIEKKERPGRPTAKRTEKPETKDK